MKLNDRIFGLGLLVIAIAYGTSAFYFPEPFAGSAMVGPGTFPKLLAALLGAVWLSVRNRHYRILAAHVDAGTRTTAAQD